MNRVNDAESYGYPAVVGYFSYGAYREWPWGDAVAREAAADAVRCAALAPRLGGPPPPPPPGNSGFEFAPIAVSSTNLEKHR